MKSFHLVIYLLTVIQIYDLISYFFEKSNDKCLFLYQYIYIYEERSENSISQLLIFELRFHKYLLNSECFPRAEDILIKSLYLFC